MSKLNYVPLTKQNYQIILQLQTQIFPEDNGEYDYLEYLENDDKGDNAYYIVYDKNVPIGITGLYVLDEFPDTIWLGWYGVLEEYRGMGFGKQILLDSIDFAKQTDKKWFRLYSTEYYDKVAIKLYKKVMQIYEYYNNPDDVNDNGHCMIFSYSICDEPIDYWNDKFINLKEDNETSSS